MLSAASPAPFFSGSAEKIIKFEINMDAREKKQIDKKLSDSFIWIIACGLLFWMVFAMFLIHARWNHISLSFTLVSHLLAKTTKGVIQFWITPWCFWRAL
jgi:hypothetical protein